MAVVLLAVLVVPLVTAVESAAGRAEMAMSQAAHASGWAEDHGTDEAWEWGEAVSSAWWRPGPTLHIRTEGTGETAAEGGESIIAGLWADGWFLENGHRLMMAPSRWAHPP